MLKDHDSITPQTRGDSGKNLILKKDTTEIELKAPTWIIKRTRSVTVKTAYITKNNKKRISVNRPSIVDNRDGLSQGPDSKVIVASPVESVNPSPKYSMRQRDAFKRWFGNSEIVDDGEPLVVYHTSHNDFTVFDKNRW